MKLGIFAKTFPRSNLEETLDAVAAHGLTHVQFNLSCVGLPTLPGRIDDEQCAQVAAAFRERDLTMAAISGTFNMCRHDWKFYFEELSRDEQLSFVEAGFSVKEAGFS